MSGERPRPSRHRSRTRAGRIAFIRESARRPARRVGCTTSRRSVTLSGRRPARMAGDPRRRSGRWRCRWCVACGNSDGADPGRPTSPAALVARRAGLGPVGPGRRWPGRGRLAGPAAAPDRPARAARPDPQGSPPGARVGQRGHRWGGAGRPPAPPPGGLAAAGPGPDGVRERARLWVHQLRRRPPRRRASRRPGRRVHAHHPRHGEHLARLCPAAHPHRDAAVAPLALVGQGHGGHAGRLGGGRAAGGQARWPARPAGRQPAGPACVRRGPAGCLPGPMAVTNLALVAAAASLVVRFRRARGVERQQLRWVALATVVLALLIMVVVVALTQGAFALAGLAGSLCLLVLPVAVGAAVLRYRLYDLDRIISRTLAYGLLRSSWGPPMPGSCSGWAGCCPRAPAWPWPPPPWPWPRCSSQPAATSSRPWIGASTDATTTPPKPSRRSAPGCAIRSTWTRCRPSCWP